MARKTKVFTIPPHEPTARDDGKIFLITEMSAFQAEKWAQRALLALTRTEVNIPDGETLRAMGWAALAYIGLQGLKGVQWDEAEPLFDEMMTCVQVHPDAGNLQVVRHLLPDDIEEVETILRLRQEVFELHAGFLMAVIRSQMAQTERAPTN